MDDDDSRWGWGDGRMVVTGAGERTMILDARAKTLIVTGAIVLPFGPPLILAGNLIRKAERQNSFYLRFKNSLKFYQYV